MVLTQEETLPVQRVGELESQPPDQAWLIRSVWAKSAVGIIGGPPKCCKSWLGLDMAVSVASGTPCLDRFPVLTPGPVLVFLAEDAITAVRARIDALCAHRRLDIQKMGLYAITASTLRLDLAHDQKLLHATLRRFRPRLLLLDPLVRLHRLDENSATEISSLLGFVRELQRTHDTAIVLVHHASKKQHAQPGQALRGSSDLHAFGDSNAYLGRRGKRLVLTLEHRAAKPPNPFELELDIQTDGSAIHLKPVSPIEENANFSLSDRIITLLRHASTPMSRTAIRDYLKVNNQRLGDTLISLEQQNLILKTPNGWTAVFYEQTDPKQTTHRIGNVSLPSSHSSKHQVKEDDRTCTQLI